DKLVSSHGTICELSWDPRETNHNYQEDLSRNASGNASLTSWTSSCLARNNFVNYGGRETDPHRLRRRSKRAVYYRRVVRPIIREVCDGLRRARRLLGCFR